MPERSNARLALCFILLAVFATLFLTPISAHAANPYAALPFDIMGYFDADGDGVFDFWSNTCKEDTDHGLIERFVLCTRMTVTRVFSYFLYNMYPFFEPIVYAALTLSIILFGVRALAGAMDNVARSCMLMALKLACVIYFTTSLDDVFEVMTTIMDNLLYEVTQFAYIGGSHASPIAKLRCEFNPGALFVFNALDFSGSHWPFWARMDCIVDGVIGLSHDNATGRYDIRLSQGLTAFFIYALASGLWGFIIFAIGMVICITLVLCVLRCVQLYLLSFIMITILCLMGMLFIPLILFDNQVIKEMFKKWVITGIGYIIQPVLMFGFLSLLMTVFDVIMFSGTEGTNGYGSLMYTIAGKESEKRDFNLQKYLADNNMYDLNRSNFDYFLDSSVYNTQSPCTGPMADQGALANIPCLVDAPATTDAVSNIAKGIDMKAINWQKVGELRNPPFRSYKADMTENVQYNVAAAMIMAALSIFVFNTFMTYLPQIIGTLGSGGDRNITSTSGVAQAGYDLPGTGAASSAVGSLGRGIEGKLGFR
ncbi:MAG: type IV secretion system protein [Rickettsiales bacterium]